MRGRSFKIGPDEGIRYRKPAPWTSNQLCGWAPAAPFINSITTLSVVVRFSRPAALRFSHVLSPRLLWNEACMIHAARSDCSIVSLQGFHWLCVVSMEPDFMDNIFSSVFDKALCFACMWRLIWSPDDWGIMMHLCASIMREQVDWFLEGVLTQFWSTCLYDCFSSCSVLDLF